MKEKILLQLEISYTSLASLLVLLAFVSIHAQMRAAVLLIMYLFVLTTHIMAGRGIPGEKMNTMFSLVTVLWIVKVFIFVLNEGLNYFLRRTTLILDWVDLMFLFVIAFLTCISFIYKKPFWYIRTKRGISTIFGTVAFLFLGWISVQVFLAFMDFYRTK